MTYESSPADISARNSRQRYCKLCGSSIDPATQQCSACGNQCFRFSRIKSLFVFCAFVLLIAGLVFCVYKIHVCHTEIESLNAVISSFDAEKEAFYSEGFETGKVEGYDEGKADGYKSGKTIGYQHGYDDAKKFYTSDKYKEASKEFAEMHSSIQSSLSGK